MLNFEIDEVFRYSSRDIFLFDRGSDGMLYTFYSVARREHIVGLWRGLVPVSFFFLLHWNLMGVSILFSYDKKQDADCVVPEISIPPPQRELEILEKWEGGGQGSQKFQRGWEVR